MESQKMNATRGSGLLENFLARKRANMANRLIRESSKQGRILDIGCGSTPLFLMSSTVHEKYGIDPNLSEIGFSDAIKSVDNLHLIKFDIEADQKLPFEDNFFDVVTMLAVFEHIEQDKLNNTLTEIKRVLKKNGRFILTTPCTWTDTLLRVMSKLRLVSSKEIEEHKGAYNHNAIKDYLINSGFDKTKMHFGYFELYLNNYAYVDK
jgi:ubiquinone/menaquinone biosynthesis C-methylase UbiE